MVAYVNIGSYYFIGIPMGILLGWLFNLGVLVRTPIHLSHLGYEHFKVLAIYIYFAVHRVSFCAVLTTSCAMMLLAGNLGGNDRRNCRPDANPGHHNHSLRLGQGGEPAGTFFFLPFLLVVC